MPVVMFIFAIELTSDFGGEDENKED